MSEGPRRGPATGGISGQAPRVIYIAGLGRSGSTLLARMLGQLDEVVSVGELHLFWRTGALARSEEERCGCGRSFGRCPFWSAVLDEVFPDGAMELSEEQLPQLNRRVDRMRYIPWMMAPRRPRRYARDLANYQAFLLRLYAALARVGGGRVIVDASKNLSPLFLLSTLPALEVHVVHLIRDPRGVAFSWSKLERRPELPGREAYMRRFGAADIAWRWSYSNVLGERARRRHRSYLRMRYEDLLADPRLWLGRIVALGGLGRRELSFIEPGSADLARDSHMLAGNPMRFQKGRVALRLDEEWRAAMPTRQRRTVSALTWPLRRRYGYAGKS